MTAVSASARGAPEAVRTGTEEDAGARARDMKGMLLGLIGARIVLGLVAIPLVPILYERHFPFVVLLRPSKDVLLGGGFLVRQGDAALAWLLLAAIPLALGGVWLMYVLGLAYKQDLDEGDLPGVAGRLLKRKRIHDLQGVLDEKGWPLVFFGRLASFPSSVLAAAAGASGMDPREFLLADGSGALASIVVTLGAGWVLGEAYKSAGPWLALVGLAVLIACATFFGYRLRRQSTDKR